MLEKFDVQPEKRWEFFSDQVMGGISTGKISFNNENQLNYIKYRQQKHLFLNVF
jgi:hypothetical protein